MTSFSINEETPSGEDDVSLPKAKAPEVMTAAVGPGLFVSSNE